MTPLIGATVVASPLLADHGRALLTNPKVSKATSLEDVAQIGIVEEAAYNCGESLQATES
jgi:hypothetical protein